MPRAVIECCEAGHIPYGTAFQWQQKLAVQRRRGKIADRLILLEHLPVLTFGRQDSRKDLLVSKDFLKGKGITTFKSDRGGRITYHGPGQLIGYLIFDLKEEKIPNLVWKIEEVLISLLHRFGLDAKRDPRNPGVWIGKKKIGALGLHVSHGITTHGFSLNVACDLRPFKYVKPCGIADCEVTSLERELDWRPSMRDVKRVLLENFSRVFGSKITLLGHVSTLSE